MDAGGKWRFAPAYDFTFSSSAFGHHSTMVAGESRNPGKAQLLELSETFGISRAETILAEVKQAVDAWPRFASSCGVSKDTIHSIGAVLGRVE
jgi:serine/threonine-protein kinase HipA